ncbi:MAG: ABC transporter substrate-binding protein, partial [Vallitaleaceae bacterium]|nr:ABC transporter substrate-binding protein [Vallitaleaceae bacterium]
ENNIESVDSSLKGSTAKKDAGIVLQGVLPCPVRVPLLEGFEGWLAKQDDTYKEDFSYELKAASMGVDWLKEDLKNAVDEHAFSDIFLSAGFDLFFDKNLLGKYKERHIFKDFTNFTHYNKDFENDYMSLKDPKGEYSMIGVVPAVFLINQNVLEGRQLPLSWADVLKPEFENSVSLPVGDFDLFNAILLNIFKAYGEEGIRNLRRSFYVNLHPSEMVKSHTKRIQPTITIMPYFFTKTVREGGPMVAVWPSDGAIISPIFMLTKASKEKEVQPIVDFFASKEVGEILSHNGRFPSIHPDVDNQVPANQMYMWIGWDYINSNDIAVLIEHCTDIFEGRK